MSNAPADADGHSEHELSIGSATDHDLALDISFGFIGLSGLTCGFARMRATHHFVAGNGPAVALCVTVTRNWCFKWHARVVVLDDGQGDCPSMRIAPSDRPER